MRPRPPRNRCANVTPSIARKPAFGSSQARRTCRGEKMSDCGSEICGQPAKTLGVQNGSSPRASDAARKRTCGRNCDLASHGMVTAPDSHGHDKTSQARAKILTVTERGNETESRVSTKLMRAWSSPLPACGERSTCERSACEAKQV